MGIGSKANPVRVGEGIQQTGGKRKVTGAKKEGNEGQSKSPRTLPGNFNDQGEKLALGKRNLKGGQKCFCGLVMPVGRGWHYEGANEK